MGKLTERKIKFIVEANVTASFSHEQIEKALSPYMLVASIKELSHTEAFEAFKDSA